MNVLARAAGAVFLLLLSGAGGAEDRTRTEPVHLRANRIEIDQRQGTTRYVGKVDLRQGDLRITADRAESRSRGNTLEQVTAEGRPLTFRDTPPDQTLPVEGKARRLQYDAVAQQAHLYEQVDIRQGRDELHAGTVHYDMNAGVMRADHDEQTRPYAAIQPRARTAPIPAETP